MKKGLLLVMIFMLSSVGYAQNLKIGVLDIDKVLSEYGYMKETMRELQGLYNEEQKELDGMAKQIEFIKDDLGKSNDLMSEETLTRKKKDLFELENTYYNKFKDKKGELDKMKSTSMDLIIAKVRKKVREIAKKEKYNFVIKEIALAYHDEKNDMTQLVIDALNAEPVPSGGAVSLQRVIEVSMDPKVVPLEKIAELVNGDLEGNSTNCEITGVAGIMEAQEGQISFVANPKYVEKIKDSKASALIVSKSLETDFRPIIRCNDPYLSFTKVIELFSDSPKLFIPGVHPSASVSRDAGLGENCSVSEHVVIESGVVLGDRSVLCASVFCGENVIIGKDVLIYPHVTINSDTIIGDNCIIHSGAILGDGIQVHNYESGECEPVEIGVDVEIGANVIIKSAPGKKTIIRDGVKIDNLVRIGAGVIIESNSVIVAQTSIEDSVKIGKNATLAGQVTVSEGVSIGDGSIIAARSYVCKDIPSGGVYSGVPAIPHSDEQRVKANISRLPRLIKRIQALEEILHRSKGGQLHQ